MYLKQKKNRINIFFSNMPSSILILYLDSKKITAWRYTLNKIDSKELHAAKRSENKKKIEKRNTNVIWFALSEDNVYNLKLKFTIFTVFTNIWWILTVFSSSMTLTCPSASDSSSAIETWKYNKQKYKLIKK